MSSDYQFIDLFAGIGGIRIAFERAGGRRDNRKVNILRKSYD